MGRGSIISLFEEATVHPLLALLEGPLHQHAYNVIESAFEIELNAYLISGKSDKVEAVFAEFFEPEQARRRIVDYFDVLARIQSIFDLDDQVAVSDGGHTAGKSADIRISNTGYFAVFDRSDEALLNEPPGSFRKIVPSRDAAPVAPGLGRACNKHPLEAPRF